MSAVVLDVLTQYYLAPSGAQDSTMPQDCTRTLKGYEKEAVIYYVSDLRIP
jgi:hypothetical protein